MKLKREEIRLLLHFQWIQGLTAADAARAINKAYGSKTVTKQTAYNWYAKFGEVGRNLKDKPRSGRPQEVDRDAVLSAIEENPTLTTRMLAEDFVCHHSTIEGILHGAGLKWRKTRWVPHKLTEAQKQKRVQVATELRKRQRADPFLQNLVTMDETWLPFNNPNPHNAWLLPGQRAPATPVPDFRQKKIMLSVFWGPAGVIHWEFLDRTVNSEVYCDQLDRVAEIFEELGREEPVVFLHDNARPHTSRQTNTKLATLNWDVLPHAPYSPDKAPSDYHLFRSLKSWLKGRNFNTVDEARVGVQEFFDSKDQHFYGRGIDNLVDRWEQIIAFDGDYV
jgi:histone-lysine N-methyltransferase SETMAR